MTLKTDLKILFMRLNYINSILAITVFLVEQLTLETSVLLIQTNGDQLSVRLKNLNVLVSVIF